MVAKLFGVIVAIILSVPARLPAQVSWNAYSSDVTFKIKNAGLSVTGRFSGIKTQLKFSPDRLSSSEIKGSAMVATLTTGINKRDEHLKKEEYFNVDKYPAIEISSVKLYARGAGYAGLFSVSLKGRTRQVEIPFEFIQKGSDAEFKGTFTINRLDYGVGGKSWIMSDDVVINIDVKARE